MDAWYCRGDYGWIGAVVDVLLVVGLASWWWRVQGWRAGLRRGAGALSEAGLPDEADAATMWKRERRAR